MRSRESVFGAGKHAHGSPTRDARVSATGPHHPRQHEAPRTGLGACAGARSHRLIHATLHGDPPRAHAVAGRVGGAGRGRGLRRLGRAAVPPLRIRYWKWHWMLFLQMCISSFSYAEKSRRCTRIRARAPTEQCVCGLRQPHAQWCTCPKHSLAHVETAGRRGRPHAPLRRNSSRPTVTHARAPTV